MALRGGDLKGFVEDVINIDLYKAKMGSDDGITVLSFEVKDKGPAEDLMNFLEKGYDYILDADLTAGETESGNYMVFVEMERTEMLPKQMTEILADVTRLTEIQNWKFKYYKRDTVHEFSTENIAEIVPTSVEAYTAQIDELQHLIWQNFSMAQIYEKLVSKIMMLYYTNNLLNINLKYIILVIEELLQKKWGHH